MPPLLTGYVRGNATVSGEGSACSVAGTRVAAAHVMHAPSTVRAGAWSGKDENGYKMQFRLWRLGFLVELRAGNFGHGVELLKHLRGALTGLRVQEVDVGIR